MCIVSLDELSWLRCDFDKFERIETHICMTYSDSEARRGVFSINEFVRRSREYGDNK